MVASVKTFVANAPELVQMAKEDLAVVGEVVRGKLNDQWLELGASLIKKHDAVHDAHDKVGTVPVVNTAQVAAAE